MDISRNSELRTLNLDPIVLNSRRLSRPSEWATTLLSQLSSNHMEEIKMGIECGESKDLERLDWATVQESLARLSQLRRITFSLYELADSYRAEAEAFIRKKLPSCDVRGVIHFNYAEKGRNMGLFAFSYFAK
jgi:hypothetical protein